jgi:6-pyruvoyltetrahydropterin/6-carboxytetrahydropterin synthase
MSFEVGVVAQFTANHHLVGNFGPASLPHSHTYRVEVGVTGNALRQDGTLFDIALLQQAVAEVVAELEGRNLNDLPVAPVTVHPPGPTPSTVATSTLVCLISSNPTAEVIARYFFDRVAIALSASGVNQLGTRIWESPEAYASYSGDLA